MNKDELNEMLKGMYGINGKNDMRDFWYDTNSKNSFDSFSKQQQELVEEHTSQNSQNQEKRVILHYEKDEESIGCKPEFSYENEMNQGIDSNIGTINQSSIYDNTQNVQKNFEEIQSNNINNEDYLNGGFLNLENLNGTQIGTNYYNSNEVMTQQPCTPVYNEPIYEQVPFYGNQYFNCNSNNYSSDNLSSNNSNYGTNLRDNNILKSLKEQIDRINQNEGETENKWVSQLCVTEPIFNLKDANNELKKFLSNLETRQTFVKVFLKSKRVKVLQEKILCNLKGYWEDTSKMEDKNRYDNLSTVFYIETKKILGEGISLSNINRLIGRDQELWNPIEKMILSEREFSFESSEENKSLKQIVRENDWINFKSYIVNPRTLEVIKKQTTKIDELEIDITSYILENNLTFDCCINVDPQVVECNGEYMLEKEEDIDAEIFEYFCQTSLGNNKDKRKLLLQYLGYSISSNKDKKKALYVIGAPDTGKTRVKDLFESYYDKTLISDKALSSINSNAARHKLMQVKINVADESNGNSINRVDTFKRIVSGEQESYNRFGTDRSDYYNLALVFLANEFIGPVTGNETPVGYLDKFSILKTERFDFKFVKYGKEEFKKAFIDEDNKGRNNRDKVITLALYELNRLYKNEFEFVETEDAKEEKIKHVRKWIAKELKKGSDEFDIRSELEGFKYSPYEYESYREDSSDKCTEGIDKIRTVKNEDGVIELFPSKEAITDEYLMKAFIDEKLEFIDADLNSSIKDMDISMVELEKGIFNIYKSFTSHRVDGLDLLKVFTEFKLSKQTSNTELKFLLKKIEIVQNEDKSKIKDIRNQLSYFLDLMKSELAKNEIWVIEENKYKIKSKDTEKRKNEKIEYGEKCRTKAIESILDNHKILILKELRVTNNSGLSSRLGFVGVKFKE